MAENFGRIDDIAGESVLSGRRPHADVDLLGLVSEGLSDGFGLLARDFTILRLNAAAVTIDGRPREMLLGRSHWEVYPGTEHSEVGRLYRQAMATGVPVSLHHRYAWPDGRVSELETRAFPVENGCLAVLYRDVTEEHSVLGQLRASEQRFRAAVAAIDGVLWTNSADGRMIGEQPGWAALTGQGYDEYQDFGWSKAVHPDDAQPTIDAWNKAIAANEPFVFEHRVRRQDGAWRTFAIRAVPIIDDAGAISEWVGVHTDITDYRVAQERVARNAETFTKLVTSNPFGIFVVDAGFTLSTVSQGAAAVFAGIDPLIGRNLDEVLHIVWPPAFADEVVARVRHTLATGEPYVAAPTIEPRASIDAVEAYDWRIERIVLPDGRFGVVCYFYDLSERNAYEAQLIQAVADKDLLAREIDHRVKNSLAVVGSLLHMQRRASASDETRGALAEAADRVMAVARVHERLHQSNQIGLVAFGDYLDQMCKDLEASMRDHAVELEWHAVPVDLSAEQALPLALIANELVTNAFKHGRNGGATMIRISLEHAADSVVLTVSDNGAGMPATTPDRPVSLGFKLISTLTRQLDAKATFPHAGAPARFTIELPPLVP